MLALNQCWLLIDDMRNLGADYVARTAQEGREYLTQLDGIVTHVMFDHDSGPLSDMDGYQVVKWALDQNLMPENVQLVTSNTVGRCNMSNVLQDAGYRSIDGINFQKLKMPTQSTS